MFCYALWVFIDGVIFRETQCLWLEFEKIESNYKSKLLKFLEIVNLSHWNMSQLQTMSVINMFSHEQYSLTEYKCV